MEFVSDWNEFIGFDPNNDCQVEGYLFSDYWGKEE